MGNYVYKYVYDKEIIYIGKNDTDLRSRINQHTYEGKFLKYLDKCKIYYIELNNSGESDTLETLLINKYKPVLNVAKIYNSFAIEFKEPKWKLYKEQDFIKQPNMQHLANRHDYLKATTYNGKVIQNYKNFKSLINGYKVCKELYENVKGYESEYKITDREVLEDNMTRWLRYISGIEIKYPNSTHFTNIITQLIKDRNGVVYIKFNDHFKEICEYIGVKKVFQLQMDDMEKEAIILINKTDACIDKFNELNVYGIKGNEEIELYQEAKKKYFRLIEVK